MFKNDTNPEPSPEYGTTSSGGNGTPFPGTGIVVLSYLSSFGALLLDSFSPTGYTEWPFYLIPLLLISYTNDTLSLFRLAVLNTALLVIGYFFSENIADWTVIFHRVVGIGMIWTLSTNIYKRTRAQKKMYFHQARLKESQDDLNRAQAVARIGSWRIDIVTFGLIWSEEVYRIFGIPKTSPMNYDKFLERVHPDDRTYVDRQWSAALAGSPYDIEHRIIVDKTTKWVHEKAELEFDSSGNLAGGFGTVQDVTSQRQVLQALKESENRLKNLNDNLETAIVQRTEQVRALSKALTLAEQRERKRFSYVLHENLQQQLLGANLLLRQHIEDHRSSAEADESDDVARGVEVLDKALRTVKTLSVELNPPILSTEGLDRALEWLVKHMKAQYGLEVDFHKEGQIGQVRNETQLMLTQMVRELLNNVVQHSGVRSARLEAVCGYRQMRITVSDRGKGFDPDEDPGKNPDSAHLGLLSLRERLRLFGGNLTIDSARHMGTRMVIVLPVDVCG